MSDRAFEHTIGCGGTGAPEACCRPMTTANEPSTEGKITGALAPDIERYKDDPEYLREHIAIRDGEITTLTDALTEAQTERDKALERMRLNNVACEICWTASFAPCTEDTPNALPDPQSSATDMVNQLWMVCQMCDRDAHVREQSDALTEARAALAKSSCWTWADGHVACGRNRGDDRDWDCDCDCPPCTTRKAAQSILKDAPKEQASSVSIECDDCKQVVMIPFNGDKVTCGCGGTSWSIAKKVQDGKQL